MKKVFKWTGIAIGSLIVLIVLALIIVPFFIDIQKFKPAIEQQVSNATGRAFSIGGDLKLSLFPWAGLSFSDVAMGNPEGFTEKDFISVSSFDVKVRFMPLLKKDIQVRRFVLTGPRIVLERAEDGTANWQGLVRGDSTAAQVQEEEEATGQDSSGTLPIKGLTVAEFIVSEGELLYIDHASGTTKDVSDLNIELRDVSLERPVSLAFSANIDGMPYSIEGEVGPIGSEPGKGAMTIDLAIKAMDMLSMTIEGTATDVASAPQFDLSISTDPFPPMDLVKGIMPDFELKTADPEALKSLSLAMKVKGTTDNMEVTDGTIVLDQSRMAFSASLKDLARPDITFKMDLDTIDADRYMPVSDEENAAPVEKATAETKEPAETDYTALRKLILDSTVDIGELTVKGARVEDIQVRITAQDGVFNIDPLSLKTYDGSVSCKAVMDVSKDIPAIQADLEIKGLRLRNAINGLLPDLVLNTKDPEVLKTLSLKMKVKGTKENISLSDGAIELDQSKMTFSASLKDLARPDITFKMDLDTIDADRYLPPPVESEETETAAGPQTEVQEQTKIDYAPLRKLVLDSAVSIGAITVRGIGISNIQAKTTGKNGVFNLSAFSLNAYEGAVSGNGSMDATKDTPAIKTALDISKVQVKGLVSTLMKKDLIEGIATGTINLSMSGDTPELIKKTMNGKGDITLKDGAIVGVDIQGMINNIKTAFGKADATESTERTDFSTFTVPFEIKDGVVNTQNTSIVSPAMRCTAAGSADLTKETLDFRIEPTFVKTLKGQGDTKDRSGVTVPVLVTGTFTEPKYSPDLSGLAEKAIEKGIEKGLDKLIKEKTGSSGDGEDTDSTKDAVKGLLKGLLGN